MEEINSSLENTLVLECQIGNSPAYCSGKLYLRTIVNTNNSHGKWLPNGSKNSLS